ncbi:hypothetical protein [Thaumasiovibrio sp. DFM-14]|uniref:hypothetical protein n=1 Tax=Thaumasiovibrio sp. DFM-14 TaxID=3384792 RepID=UPI0039A1BAAB
MFKCEIDCHNGKKSFADVETAIGYVSEILIPDHSMEFHQANISINRHDRIRDYVYSDAENLLEDLMNL